MSNMLAVPATSAAKRVGIMGSSSCWVMATRQLLVACALAILASTPAFGHAVERRVQEHDDFTYTAGGPDLAGSSPIGVTSSAITVYQFPALETQGVGMIVVNFEACGILPPHVHPRATEMVYMLSGTLRTTFVDESEGTRRAIVNDVSAGDATIFPQGLTHYLQNLGCEEASYVAGVSDEDPGVIFVVPMDFSPPEEEIEGITGVNFQNQDSGVAAMLAGILGARHECLMECGLLPDDGKASQEGQTCPGGIEGINANDDVCCSLSCGECGGSGCGSRPGGAAACCISNVKDVDVYCDESGFAPCIIGTLSSSSNAVEVGTKTGVLVTATAHDERAGRSSEDSGCGLAGDGGCKPILAHDGVSGEIESRWSCATTIVESGGPCEIEFVFDEPQDIVDIEVAFWKGDQRTRTLEVKLNGETTHTHESYSEATFNSLGIEADNVDTVTLASIFLEPNEWISLLEVVIMVKP